MNADVFIDTNVLLYTIDEASKALGQIAEPLFARVRAGMNESRHLAARRDYLLPKLLSGAIRVTGAERAIA